MAEALEVIFRSGWTFFGTIVLVMFLGWALSMPFFWWYKMKKAMTRAEEDFKQKTCIHFNGANGAVIPHYGERQVALETTSQGPDVMKELCRSL